MQNKEDAAWEQKPYEPTKKELAEMDELRAQAEQEIHDRKRKRI